MRPSVSLLGLVVVAACAPGTDDQSHTDAGFDAPCVTACVPSIRICLVATDGTTGACSAANGEALDVPTLEFGDVRSFESTTRKLVVSNVGTGTLQITRGTFKADLDDVPFDFAGPTPTTFEAALAAGQSAEITVRLGASTRDEPLSATLELASNDAAHPTVTVPIRARLYYGMICITPEHGLDFGRVVVGTSDTHPLRVQNCGAIALDLTEFTFAEALVFPAEYSLTGMPTVSAQAPRHMAPGDEFTVQVTYAPVSVTAAADPGDLASFSIAVGPFRDTIPVVGLGVATGE